MEKNVIVVGAGIAGLSAGSYACMNGFKTTIFEMHKIPGGLCTAWKRKGYTFDISMHLVTASRTGIFNRMWRELGIAESTEFHYHDHLNRVEGKGKSLTYSTDRKKVEEQMLEISPDDAPLIKELAGLLFGRDMLDAATLKPAELTNMADKLRSLPYILPMIKIFRRYSGKTLQEFAAKFKDPFLRDAVRFVADTPGWPMPGLPMIILSGFMNSAVIKSGVPLGGSQQAVSKTADLFTKLGGKIRYGSHVSNLIVENNRVKGITLDNGEEHLADYIIWAADGHTLLFDILKEKYLNECLREMYSSWIPVKPLVHVMIGVNRDFSSEPHCTIFEADNPPVIAGRERKWIFILHHSFDPSMAPAGKSAVEVWYETDYDYWEKLSADRQKYEAEKKSIADLTISQLEKKYSGFASQVEVIDVPTPMTYKRYTGNWKSSPDGWYITNSNFQNMEPVHTVPGLDGIFMAGQWTAPYTGTVIAALSGRQAVHLLCKNENRKFTTL